MNQRKILIADDSELDRALLVDMLEHDFAVADADQTGSLNIFALLQAQGLAAHHAGHTGPAGEGKRDKQVDGGLAQGVHNPHGQQQGGDGQHNIRQAHDDIIHPAAKVTGQQAKEDAHHQRDDAGQNTEGKR